MYKNLLVIFFIIINFNFVKAEEKKWGEFLKVWTNYKDSLILFLAPDIQLRGLWKQKVAEWLESKPIEPVTLSLLRFTFNLEAFDKNLSRVTTLFDAYMDTDNHIFSTQLISAVCQFFPPRQCIRMKEKVLKNNPNHPVGSLTKFPRNMWSLPN